MAERRSLTRCAACGSAATCSTTPTGAARACGGAGARPGGARAICSQVGDRLAAIVGGARAALLPARRGGVERVRRRRLRALGRARRAARERRAGRAATARWRSSRARRPASAAARSTPPPRGARSAASWPRPRRKLAAIFFRAHRRRCCGAPDALDAAAAVGRRSAATSTASTAGRASSSPRPTSPPRRTRCSRSHPGAYRLWAGAGAALYPAVKEREFFGHLPRALQRWSDARAGPLPAHDDRAGGAGARRTPSAFYRELPASLASLDAAGARRAAARRSAPAGKRLAGVVADLAPVAGALVQQVPQAAALDALAHARARRRGLSRRRRSPRCARCRASTRKRTPAMVREWFDAGLRARARQPRRRRWRTSRSSRAPA